jgi:hypothetical protein
LFQKTLLKINFLEVKKVLNIGVSSSTENATTAPTTSSADKPKVLESHGKNNHIP